MTDRDDYYTNPSAALLRNRRVQAGQRQAAARQFLRENDYPDIARDGLPAQNPAVSSPREMLEMVLRLVGRAKFTELVEEITGQD